MKEVDINKYHKDSTLLEDKNLKKVELLNKIKEKIKEIRTYTPKVAIFGDSGVGKSSLCNALFGKDVAKVSDVEVGTTKPQEIKISNQGGGLILIDFPGIGDGKNDYTELYKDKLKDIDLVIWVIKSDDRSYQLAVEFYKDVLKPNIDICPVVFAITQVDKIEPIEEWYENNNNKLGENQKNNLVKKINDISNVFDISTKYIIGVSSKHKYNLIELVSKIVDVLPNEKKSSFTRETKEENVTEETFKKAEKGTWEAVKDYAEDLFEGMTDIAEEVAEFTEGLWNELKDNVSDMIKSSAPKVMKYIFSKWF